MALTGKQKHHLRALAHHKNPVVIIGDAGLTEAVLAEIEAALARHELIKVKVRADRDERREILAQICERTGAEAVQSIGQVVVIFRRADVPLIELPR
jgi:RNA-binding protein